MNTDTSTDTAAPRPELSPQAAPEADGDTRTSSAWTLVAGREIAVKLTDKAYLISTLTTLVLIVAIIGLRASSAA